MQLTSGTAVTVDPEREPLLVTTSWDDGHPADLRLADLLEKHGIGGTFYIPCRNSEGKPVMHSNDVTELGRQFEVAGHTRDHISLTDIPLAVAADQILGNKHRLEDLLGREVCGFAYVRGLHNDSVRRLVADAGYRYARTVKNFMSTPGAKPLEVPATAQFFAHSRATYIRNYISGGPTLQRAAVLCALIRVKELVDRLMKAAEACNRVGAHFHLWGHSWEIDDYNLWGELDRLLSLLRQLRARFVTNADWCARLRTSVGTVAEAGPPGPGRSLLTGA